MAGGETTLNGYGCSWSLLLFPRGAWLFSLELPGNNEPLRVCYPCPWSSLGYIHTLTRGKIDSPGNCGRLCLGKGTRSGDNGDRVPQKIRK